MILAILALVTASFQPPAPKVGDLITVRFAAPVTLDASNEYEIVSRSGNVVVVRTFKPEPFALSGVTNGVRFKNLNVPVQSVLQPNDPLTPAPLVPPREASFPRAAALAIVLLALSVIALIVWYFRRKKRAPVQVPPEPQLAPSERYRRAVLALREESAQPKRWAKLADETRLYLAATRPHLPTDLTTTELVPRLAAHDRVVIEILRQGDREKFSPWGAEAQDFDEVANRALEIVQ